VALCQCVRFLSLNPGFEFVWLLNCHNFCWFFDGLSINPPHYTNLQFIQFVPYLDYGFDFSDISIDTICDVCCLGFSSISQFWQFRMIHIVQEIIVISFFLFFRVPEMFSRVGCKFHQFSAGWKHSNQFYWPSIWQSFLFLWLSNWFDCCEGMVAERPRKRGKRYLNCTPSKLRPHRPILLLLVFNSVQL